MNMDSYLHVVRMRVCMHVPAVFYASKARAHEAMSVCCLLGSWRGGPTVFTGKLQYVFMQTCCSSC